jgi:hypothetical protein
MAMLAPDPTVTDPAYRLGVATEILRQIIDPASPLSVHERIHPGVINQRIVDFLAAEAAITPPPGPDPQRVPLLRAIAHRVPWPASALDGLWPGDRVFHEEHGPGEVQPIADDEYPERLELLTHGSLLVGFDSGARWVPAVDCQRTSPAEAF